MSIASINQERRRDLRRVASDARRPGPDAGHATAENPRVATGVAPERAPGPGQLILGRYEILRFLGRGATGSVYACRDRLLCNWTVAMKTVRRGLLDEESLLCLRREMTAMKHLSHGNVAKVYDLLVTPDLVGYTMEYVDGGMLSDGSRPGFPLSIAEIVIRLLQTCSGLGAIHRAGLVHRDLKPQNILINREGIVKIVDFGVCIPAPHVPPPLERLSHEVFRFHRDLKRMVLPEDGISGTIEYMSPEQLDGGQVDQRSDIYALGVVAYELIVGKTPYQDLLLPDLLFNKVYSDQPPPHQRRRDCPPELSAIVMKAMRRDPAERYTSAEAMLHDLWGLNVGLSLMRCSPAPSRAGRIWAALKSLTR